MSDAVLVLVTSVLSSIITGVATYLPQHLASVRQHRKDLLLASVEAGTRDFEARLEIAKIQSGELPPMMLFVYCYWKQFLLMEKSEFTPESYKEFLTQLEDLEKVVRKM